MGLAMACQPVQASSSALGSRLSARILLSSSRSWQLSGPESCQDLEELSKILAESRDPKALLDAWTGWHAIAKPIRQDFVRYVDLANKGARQLGFKDNGAMWRSKYDMAPDDFAKELDRLWEQVKPLY